jgi:hypothetical protein
LIIRIAERFGVLPDEAENMSEYWFNRTVDVMQAEAINRKEEESNRAGR